MAYSGKRAFEENRQVDLWSRKWEAVQTQADEVLQMLDSAVNATTTCSRA